MQHSTLAALFYYEIITWQPGYSHVLAHVFNVIHERFNFYNAGNKLVYILTPACNRTARAFIHVCVCMCIWLAVGAYIQVFLFFRFLFVFFRNNIATFVQRCTICFRVLRKYIASCLGKNVWKIYG